MAAVGQATDEEGSKPSSAAGSEAQMQAAREEIQRAIALSGLQRDPLAHTLRAMGAVLDAMGATVGDIRTAAQTARAPISPKAEEEVVRRLENAALRGADARAIDLVTAHNRRTVVIAAAVLAGSVIAAGAGGFWWGISQPVPTIMGPQSREVAALLSANNWSQRIAECRPLGEQPNGKRACAMNVWLE